MTNELQLYNSLNRRKEKFEPLHKGRVNIYVCGPTVYDEPHIGHAKSYLTFDILVRYLRYLGYRVRYVQNITDVGHLLDSGQDRILLGAQRERVEPMELVERYTRAYFKAMDELNVVRPDISPHAAAHVPEQIELVSKLIENGVAYEVNGSVYFDVSRWPSYGRLTGRKIEQQQAGARVDVNPEKRHPADFALWKRAEPAHLMQWNSPWGRGYPGWHVECSAMAMKYLGETLDIHGGGIENQFPHHECEIAQSEAATGSTFARYWLHNNMVLVDGVKMSKSLDNFTTIADALEKYSGDQIRFFILQTHYRSPVDFNDKTLVAAGTGLERLVNTAETVNRKLESAKAGEVSDSVETLCRSCRSRFEQEMNNDLNTPAALGHLFDFAHQVNRIASEDDDIQRASWERVRSTLFELAGDVLGLRLESGTDPMSASPLIDLLITVRGQLREKKEWALSDWIREQLAEMGITIEDSEAGTRWKRE